MSASRAMARVAAVVVLVLLPARNAAAAEPGDPLALGAAMHAFDHLGNIGEQAPAAAASGATIIYSSGVGSLGYEGLPPAQQFKTAQDASKAYLRDAKSRGIRLAIGYVCATSIVKLDAFDRNWPPELRHRVSTPPSQWLQRDRDGKPLPSWYGGDYRPACMSNPDWREYEKSMVRAQLEAGHDGIFFDNPTVHPQGCYCEHCMRKFAAFLAAEGVKVDVPATDPTDFLRRLAIDRPHDFQRFRCTIAPDFLAEMRTFARTVKPGALITCNSSLNSPDALFSQCRTHGYNISAMSAAEDFVVVEDMATQPRVLADGKVVEYGPVYDVLCAICQGKPLVAVTIADGNYHTPPNLVRLAMAEAAAHGASYLAWPTWPQDVRQRMIDAVRPEADLLRQHADLLSGTTDVADVAVFLPFRRWIDTSDCAALATARALTRAGVPFSVVNENDLPGELHSAAPPPALVAESAAVLTEGERALVDKYRADGGRVIWSGGKDWLAELRGAVKTPAVSIAGPSTLRAVARMQANGEIVHLLNLNVRRLSSYEDQVTPAAGVRVTARCRPGWRPSSVTAITADTGATSGPVPFELKRQEPDDVIELAVPRVGVSTILVVQ